MKIGVLTHHWLYNFGANLQALTTSNYLKSLGHEVLFINYRPPELIERYESIVSYEQSLEHQRFCDLFLLETHISSSEEEVIDLAKALNLDVAISGSDAVLRLNAFSSRSDLTFPNPFWLTWTDKVGGVRRKGFLAASCMGSNYFKLSSSTKNEVKEAILQLNYLSVRDKWTKWMLSSIVKGQTKISFCPDPVVVLDEYGSFPTVDNVPLSEEAGTYILLSFYDGMISAEWVSEFVRLSHSLGYKVYTLPLPECEVNLEVDKVLKLPMSPIAWYSWIKSARAYVGVRFHPVVCAFINDVPFIAVDNYGISFGRRLTKVALKPFTPVTNYSSKTYDFCKRVNKEKYHVKAKDISKKSPTDVITLLKWQFDGRSQKTKHCELKEVYKITMNGILTD